MVTFGCAGVSQVNGPASGPDMPAWQLLWDRTVESVRRARGQLRARGPQCRVGHTAGGVMPLGEGGLGLPSPFVGGGAGTPCHGLAVLSLPWGIS